MLKLQHGNENNSSLSIYTSDVRLAMQGEKGRGEKGEATFSNDIYKTQPVPIRSLYTMSHYYTNNAINIFSLIQTSL